MTLLKLLVLVAMLLTVGTLISGIASMATGGEFDRRHEVQFMSARVALQGIAFALVALALYLAV